MTAALLVVVSLLLVLASGLFVAAEFAFVTVDRATVEREAQAGDPTARGLLVAFLSQIDRAHDLTARPYPDLRDVRLPNPLDLRLFDKACFLVK